MHGVQCSLQSIFSLATHKKIHAQIHYFQQKHKFYNIFTVNTSYLIRLDVCAARYAFQLKFSNNKKHLEQQTHAEREKKYFDYFLSLNECNAMQCKTFCARTHLIHTKLISFCVGIFEMHGKLHLEFIE